MASSVPMIKLNDGNLMPQIGFGTFQGSDDADVRAAVLEAIRVGYRHIDTAYVYHNEVEVGQGIRDAIKEGLVRREDLFVVSKLPGNGHRKEKVPYFLKKSLNLLQLDYLDLYLVHTPLHLLPEEDDDKLKNPQPDPQADHIQTWKAMEDCVRAGLTRSIGLSNFNSVQIQRIWDNAEIKPANLQVECHAYFAQNKLWEFCQKLGISMTAYGPLGAPFLPAFMKKVGGEVPPDCPVLLDDPTVKSLAAALKRTPAQVLLRWLIQRGIIVIPKSKSAHRIRENFNVFDFQLGDEDMDKINRLDRNLRMFLFRNYCKGVLEHPEFPFHIPY